MREVDISAISTKFGQSFEKAGGPQKKPRKKYPSPVTLRLTEDERTQLEKDAGGSSLSAYIRQCVFGRHASKRVVPEVDRFLVAQILAKLGETRIANNLNQENIDLTNPSPTKKRAPNRGPSI